MERLHRRHIILSFFYFMLIAYLLINTGVISDDFDAMNRLKEKKFTEILIPKGQFYFIETPLEYFTHYIWYYFFRIDNSVADSIFKVLYILVSFYFIGQFFKIYLNLQTAYLVSFMFIFFPSHDSTVYWFMGNSLTLPFAFYLYAFYLAHKNRLGLAFLLASAGSFISYGSPPLALTLFFLFLLNREVRKGLVLLIPNILYSIYYIFISKIMGIGIDKLDMAKGINFYSIVKHFILQILTFIDAMVGPSMWMKIFYSFSQLSASSLIIGIILTVIFYKKYQDAGMRYDQKLIISFLALVLLSFVMFSLTGYYPQLAFNLGNRATIFGSLLLAYLIVLMPASHKIRTLIFAIIIFTILGISDHWKQWNIHQQAVMTNIRNNPGLKNYQDTKVIYVSGNQYSDFGLISHIEFLSEGYVVHPIFKLIFDWDVSAWPINKRHKYMDGYLIDTKYNRKMQVEDYIYVYDSENDRFFKLKSAEINNYIDSLPPDNRHWIQIVDIKFLRDIVKKLMPRLDYIYRVR